MTSVVPAESAEPQKVAPGAPRSRLALALKPSAQLMQTLLFHASAGDPVRVVDRLDEDGVDVRQGDAFGNTLLHWAASRNCLPLATALLSRGADPNQANSATAHTPLHWAAAEGHALMALTLLEGGATLTCLDMLGRDALFYAVANRHEVVVHLLLLQGAHVDSQDNGALHWAAQSGSLHVALILLSAGFSVHVKNSAGDTPLHVCAREGHRDVFKALLREGGASLREVNTAGQSAEEVATEDAKAFIVGPFMRYPRHFLQRTPWTLRVAATETTVTVALYLTFVMLLQAYGWLMSLAFLIVGIGVWRYSGLSAARDERSTFWLAWAITSQFVNLYLWWTLVHDSEIENSEPLQSQMFVLVGVLIVFVSQYLVWKKGDPGFIDTTPGDDAEGFYADLKRGITEFRICPTCRIRRPLRAKHDAVTNHCVQRFDHFCQFINMPVGAGNHHFFLFILFLVAATFWQFAFLFWHALPPFSPLPMFLQSQPLLVYQYAQSIVLAGLMGYLFFNQLWYVASGYTTNEKIGQQTGKYTFLWRHGQPYSPFSRGSHLKNIMDFFTHIDRSSRVFYFPSELPPVIDVVAVKS